MFFFLIVKVLVERIALMLSISMTKMFRYLAVRYCLDQQRIYLSFDRGHYFPSHIPIFYCTMMTEDRALALDTSLGWGWIESSQDFHLFP